MRYYLFFLGRMEYARLIIILSSFVDLFQSWRFHLTINFPLKTLYPEDL
jgi:hypothetical protein